MSYARTHFFGTSEAVFHPYRQARAALKESIRKYLFMEKWIKNIYIYIYTHTHTHPHIHTYKHTHI